MTQETKYNIMERRAIPDLLDKKYYIPEYQRGYRWEEKQVLDLLDDLNTFFCGRNKRTILLSSANRCQGDRTWRREVV